MAMQRLLFSDYFEGKRDTAVLNSILEELYNRLDITADASPPVGAIFHSAGAAIQSIANNTNTAVVFDSKETDTDHMWNVVNNTRLTIKTAGIYVCTGSIEWGGQGAIQTTERIMLRKNGAIIFAEEERLISAVNQGPKMEITARPLRFSVNDYVELIVFQNSGAAVPINGTSAYAPYLSAYKVSS